MTSLTSDRNTPIAAGNLRLGQIAANQLVFAGALVMRNAAGFLEKGATSTGLIGVGRAEERVNNSGGADGEETLGYRIGTFRFANDGADPITTSDVGLACYVVDDQTVARTDGSGTRSKAGVISMIDNQGIWVSFDEALTRAAI